MISGFVGNPVVNETQNVNVTCIAFGLPEPVVTWSRPDIGNITSNSTEFAPTTSNPQVQEGGTNLQPVPQIDLADSDSAKFVTYTTSEPVQGGGMEVRSTLQVNSVNGNDTGNYTCTAENQPLGPDMPRNSSSSVFMMVVQSKFQTMLVFEILSL